MLFLVAILGGCHVSPWSAGKNDSPGTNTAASADRSTNAKTANNVAAAGAAQPARKPGDSVGRAAVGDTSAMASDSSVNAQSLQEVMAEVRELGVLDPQQQNKLLEDLRQTDPSLWPLMVKQVRAAVAYRRKSMERGQNSMHGAMLASVPAGKLPQSPANPRNGEETPPQVLPPSDGSEELAGNNAGSAATPLPPPSKIAGSMSRNGANAAMPKEGAPGVAATSLASDRLPNGAKSAAAKSCDFQSLDAKGQVTPASYESPSGQNEAAKTASRPPNVDPAAGEQRKVPIGTGYWERRFMRSRRI